LNWLRGHRKVALVQSAWIPEMVDRVCWHVEDQVFAFSGRRGAPVPSYSPMTDLMIGAYILGLLEGYIRTIYDGEHATDQAKTREILQAAAGEVCSRVFGPQWTRRVRHQLPQWAWTAGISPHLPGGTLRHVLSWHSRRSVPGCRRSALLCESRWPSCIPAGDDRARGLMLSIPLHAFVAVGLSDRPNPAPAAQRGPGSPGQVRDRAPGRRGAAHGLHRLLPCSDPVETMAQGDGPRATVDLGGHRPTSRIERGR
jgi:hypothetical protein